MSGARRAAAVALAVLTVAALTACGAARRPPVVRSISDAGSAPGPVPTVGTAFDRPLPDAVLDLELTDQRGRTLTLRSLAGTVLVLAPFMTNCQEVCPLTSVDVRDAAEAARAAGLDRDRVRFLEITIDPARDDVRTLRAYSRLFGRHPNWQLLRAAPEDLTTLWKALGVAVTRVPADEPGARGWLSGRPLTYDLQHQDVVIAVDGTGHERWLEQGTPAVAGDAPPPTLRAYLNDRGRQNLADPGDFTWSVRDVEGALTWLTGTRIG